MADCVPDRRFQPAKGIPNGRLLTPNSHLTSNGHIWHPMVIYETIAVVRCPTISFEPSSGIERSPTKQSHDTTHPSFSNHRWTPNGHMPAYLSPDFDDEEELGSWLSMSGGHGREDEDADAEGGELSMIAASALSRYTTAYLTAFFGYRDLMVLSVFGGLVHLLGRTGDPLSLLFRTAYGRRPRFGDNHVFRLC